MYDFIESDGRDELRGRFTRFMEVMVKRARLNYLEKLRRQLPTVPMDELPEELFAREQDFSFTSSDSFEFEEERLADAFRRLPLMRQRILTMIFVEDLSAEEIARRMNCSVGHVYNQRSLALKKLRLLLGKGGEDA